MNTPRYMQIAQALEDERQGLDMPMKLPDEHALARRFDVARHTVRQALGILARQGALTRLPRRGTYLQPSRPIVNEVRHRAIGFVPPYWAESISHWYTASLFDGASRWAGEAGCHLHVLPPSATGLNHAQLASRVDELGLAGLIWVHPRGPQLTAMAHLAAHLPVAVAGRMTPSADACHVMPDYDQAALLVDRHLTQLGHHHYTLLLYDAFDAYSDHLVRAFERACERRRLRFDLRNGVLDLRPYKPDMKASILLDGYEYDRQHVQAYVVLDSELMFHLVRDERFRQLVGTRRSVVAFDHGLHPLTACWPGRELSHLDCHWSEVGWQAASLLGQRIAGLQTPHCRTVAVSFEPGQTCTAFDPQPITPKRWQELWTLYRWPKPRQRRARQPTSSGEAPLKAASP